jgi:hypothetical protein
MNISSHKAEVRFIVNFEVDVLSCQDTFSRGISLTLQLLLSFIYSDVALFSLS